MFGFITKIFIKAIGGTRNDRIVRSRMKVVVDEINPLEPALRELSDEQLLGRSLELRQQLADGASRAKILPEAFALIREASRRAQNHRQYDVQLVAGMILDEGWIAEEATGEGKTIACYPAIYLAWLEGMHTHVVTVNDYLVQRDATFAMPVFALLGATVGFITAEMDHAQRQEQYACSITYGTNSEFGFDYLRDNMKLSPAEQVQGPLDFAIVDEVDSILIDEARTPLIISGPAYSDTGRYKKVDAVTREVLAKNKPWDQANKRVETLKREIKALNGELVKAKKSGQASETQKKIDQALASLDAAEDALSRETKYYEIEIDRKAAHLTHEGVALAQDIAGVGSFYVGANMDWPHLMDQSLRAHLVYERDKDYVVQQGKVIIVDEFTGRLLEGRQWSDGLHQAVEAKERVTVKEETQTLATITLQNYFKLYKKLAGMTGTAMTEAEEFLKIYGLDAAAVVTHRPVNRVDSNDLIFSEVKGKFDAIVEEINRVSKQGRPVLVGTTSIEKSEYLSNLLIREYGIEHQVLNGRPENAARENEIVALAGQQRPLKPGSRDMVGTVTIATNMAGRGTDIKLGPGVVNELCKTPPAEQLAELGVEIDPLYPPGATKCCIACEQYNAATGCAHCFKPKVAPEFPARGRSQCQDDVPCGLHIVGTERHEARRIDNQLRGRAGRQGDPGSSRFFLSLRDDLMSIFAGEWTLKVLGWLGLQGDQAIEDKRISKGVERAQCKVEQRNFEIRKNLLDYDEIMDHQRHTFYSQRQRVLEGRGLEGMVFDMLDESIANGVESYLDGGHHLRCIAEWARTNLQVPVRDDQIKAQSPNDLPSLEGDLRELTKEDAQQTITLTIGEYIDEEDEPRNWDLRGLSSWAKSRFAVDISQNHLRQMSLAEVTNALEQGAAAQIDRVDLSPIAEMLEEDFARKGLAQWASDKFDIDVRPDELTASPDEVQALLSEKARAAYRQREIEYPVEHAIDMTLGQAGAENVYALDALVNWANAKYDAGLAVESFQGKEISAIRAELIALAHQWADDEKLDGLIRDAIGSEPSLDQAIEFAAERFKTDLTPEDFGTKQDSSDQALDGETIIDRLVRTGRDFLRREMTELERFVLLQIYDSSWKDHLLGMDHLKGSIGLRGYAEQDPKVAYKSEGGRLFDDMFAGIVEKVTDMIFKVKLSAGAQMESVYQVSSQVHEQLQGYDHLAQGLADQQAAAEPQKISQIVRADIRVGRNDPCPCGSGKKFKKCCGKE